MNIFRLIFSKPGRGFPVGAVADFTKGGVSIIFRMSMPVQFDNPGAETEREMWSVTVIYEDTPTRDRAMAMCDCLMRQLWTEAELHITWWRADFLRDPRIANEAGAAAIDADVILFALRSEGELPSAITAWSDAWLIERAGHPGALITLIGTTHAAQPTPSAKEKFLYELAQRAGLDYQSDARLASTGEALPDSIDTFAQRAGEVTSVLDEILHVTTRHPPSSTRARLN